MKIREAVDYDKKLRVEIAPQNKKMKVYLRASNVGNSLDKNITLQNDATAKVLNYSTDEKNIKMCVMN